MANAIQSPWICEYLIGVAEEYGAIIGAVPPHQKSKKAQVVEFLTHPKPGTESCVWATISDKTHMIPVRFSKKAVDDYEQDPISNGRESLTDLKTAFIQIKAFRPMFTRVPLRGLPGMSETSRIMLDVQMFSVRGSFGADIWGSPKDVSSDERIKEWTEGLRSDGGGGNVLLLRKKARETREQNCSSAPSLPPENHKAENGGRHPQQANNRISKQSNGQSRAPQDGAHPNNTRKSHKSTHRRVSQQPHLFMPSLDMIEQYRDMPFAEVSDSEELQSASVQRLEPSSSRLRPQTPMKLSQRKNALDFNSPESGVERHTPSIWSESGGSSSDSEDDDARMSSPSSHSQSSFGPPYTCVGKSEQPQGSSADIGSADTHVPSLSSPPTSKAVQRQQRASLPSSLPAPESISVVLAPNSSLPSENVSAASPSLPRIHKQFARKTSSQLVPSAQKRIARKTAPRDQSIHPDISAAGRILVPNSDTSHSQHSHSQSQSQSLNLQHDPQSQDYALPERFAQSLSYSPRSQNQHEEARVSQAKPSPDLSQPRSEIGSTQLAASSDNELHASPSHAHIHTESQPSLQHLVSSHTNLRSSESIHSVPLTSKHSGNSPKDLDVVVSTTTPASIRSTAEAKTERAGMSRSASPSHQDISVVNGGVHFPSDQGQDADDEAEPDPLPSDVTVSIDDQAAEPSDENDEFTSDDAPRDTILQEEHIRTSALRASKHSTPASVVQQSPYSDFIPSHRSVASSEAQPRGTSRSDASIAPELPSRPDVFMSEASFTRGASPGIVSVISAQAFAVHQPTQMNESSPEPLLIEPEQTIAPDVVAQPFVMGNHDVGMWTAPTFLQIAAKRPLSPTSSSSREEKPKKRRKLQSSNSVTPALLRGPSLEGNDPLTALSASSISATISKSDSIVSTTARIKRIDFRRGGSVSSASTGPSVHKIHRDNSVATIVTDTKADEVMLNSRPKEIRFQSHSGSRSSRSREQSRDIIGKPASGAWSPTRRSGKDILRPNRSRVSAIDSTLSLPQSDSVGRSDLPVDAFPRSRLSREAPALPPDSITGHAGLKVALDKILEDESLPWSFLCEALMRTGKARSKETKRFVKSTRVLEQ